MFLKKNEVLAKAEQLSNQKSTFLVVMPVFVSKSIQTRNFTDKKETKVNSYRKKDSLKFSSFNVMLSVNELLHNLRSSWVARFVCCSQFAANNLKIS